MRCVQEESFGPVLTVERFTDEEDAVRIGNDTIYGLPAAVWTQDAGKGAAGGQPAAARHRVDQRLRPLPAAGGVGRLQAVRAWDASWGRAGIEEYREAKHIWQNIAPAPSHWFGD